MRKQSVFLTILFTALIFMFTSGAYAQEKLSIVVGPARQELEADPGETIQTEIRFYNQNNYPLTGIIKVTDFIVVGTEGSPRLLDTPQAASPRFSAAGWVSLPYDQITIAQQSKINVPVTITVPNDANPGGRYVAVYFETGSQAPKGSNNSGSGVMPRVAGLIYIRINGEITENALITRFYTSGFFEYGPITVNTEILNRGNYHIRPKAIIAMTNVFGTLADQVSLKEENIFPDTTRIFTTEVGQKWLFGRYKLALKGSYGGSGKALEAVAYVWVIPWRIVAIIILATILIYILIKKMVLASNKKVEELENRLNTEEEKLEELKKQLRRHSE